MGFGFCVEKARFGGLRIRLGFGTKPRIRIRYSVSERSPGFGFGIRLFSKWYPVFGIRYSVGIRIRYPVFGAVFVCGIRFGMKLFNFLALKILQRNFSHKGSSEIVISLSKC